MQILACCSPCSHRGSFHDSAITCSHYGFFPFKKENIGLPPFWTEAATGIANPLTHDTSPWRFHVSHAFKSVSIHPSSWHLFTAQGKSDFYFSFDWCCNVQDKNTCLEPIIQWTRILSQLPVSWRPTFIHHKKELHLHHHLLKSTQGLHRIRSTSKNI